MNSDIESQGISLMTATQLKFLGMIGPLLLYPMSHPETEHTTEAQMPAGLFITGQKWT